MLPGITTYTRLQGNGLTRAWTYTFSVIDAAGADLLFFTDIGGVVTQINANYAIDVANSQVTYPTVISGLPVLNTGEYFIMMRVEPVTQLTDLINHGSFDAEVLEKQLDKMTAIDQQLQYQIDQGFSVSGTGAQGASGTSGFSGVSGESLVSGWSGASGFSGIDGVSGFSGADAASGVSGWSGISGASLVSGWSGASGVSGVSGFSGESLISGWSGESGWSGRSGASGLDGQSGFSGMSGDTPGSSGVSGFSGFSGINGDSLVVPFNGTYASVSGWVTITHNLGSQFNVVQVYDNDLKQIIPDEVVSTDANTTDIDIASYGGSGISGTWNAVIKY